MYICKEEDVCFSVFFPLSPSTFHLVLTPFFSSSLSSTQQLSEVEDGMERWCEELRDIV